MEKIDKNKKLFESLKELKLPLGEYAVFGSGPMGIRNLREMHDIDLIVSDKIFNEYLDKQGWRIKEIYGYRDWLKNDNLEIEMGRDWHEGWDVDGMIRGADMIDGLPFVKLDYLIKWKKFFAREKDLKDVKLIENFLKTEKINSFLKEAHSMGYGNKNAEQFPSTKLGSEDYHFEKDGLVYHDTYFGGKSFIGEELIYENNRPIWGMNYYGFIILETAKESDIYEFLKESLIQEYSDILPFRGPKEFRKDDKKYINIVNGNIVNFNGTEEIYQNNVLVYKAYYHGGLVD